MFKKAAKWKYLPEVPDFQMIKEYEYEPTYISAQQFVDIYQACKVATAPAGLPYAAADWWKGLLVFAYLLKREDVDLEAGAALSRVADTKGKRDQRILLHPLIIAHLRKLASFELTIFPWRQHKIYLYKQFMAIQKAAGIKLACHEEHEHTDACTVFGFHDLRRGFATMNADRMTADQLQELMQHRSYSTTRRYVNMAKQMHPAVANIFVPDFLKSQSS